MRATPRSAPRRCCRSSEVLHEPLRLDDARPGQALSALFTLAALQPDLSVAMLYTLLMGVVLFAGGARMGHFVALGALAAEPRVLLERLEGRELFVTASMGVSLYPEDGEDAEHGELASGRRRAPNSREG